MVPDALNGILCALENSAFGFRVVSVCRGPVAEIPNSLRVIRDSEFLAFVPELRILLFEFGFPSNMSYQRLLQIESDTAPVLEFCDNIE